MADPTRDTLSAADRRWLDSISTNWLEVQDAGQFVLRYGPAVRAYCRALLPNPDDADDVLQELLVRVVERGFPHADARKGRFRDYLKATVRNAVITHLRRQSKAPRSLAEVDAPEVPKESEADLVWLDRWRTCLLDRAWHLLDAHERENPDGWACTVLRAAADAPDATSEHLAQRLRRDRGYTLNAAAFRKQLSRARRLFARLVVQEVAGTLDAHDADAVQQELMDCGVWESLRDLLPADWQTTLLDSGTG
jgi:RNA polymerase sigma-70 factor (ECF subfamily)